MLKRKLYKIIFLLFRRTLWYVSMPLCTKFQYVILKKMGVSFNGKPKYLSAKIWFDGADYKKIIIGKRVTISSNIRILTHDWALDTIYEGYMKKQTELPLGKINTVEIGDFSFIGTGSLIMPGTKLGKCTIVGAGSVVRGEHPDGAILIGNPAKQISINSEEYLKRHISCNI
ncbi:MAG TPA: acyltransferase [Fluviicola sp.]|nr:acyltransferase [Fluviicola sp.]